jgi:hypothetical protein
MVQKKSDYLLKSFIACVHCAVNAIAWFGPIDFADRDFARLTLGAIAELDIQPIPPSTTVTR